VTVEGLGEEGELHRVQEAFAETGAVQCGFCTPGLIVATVALLEAKPEPSEDEIREALSGNLCRCTGYAKIFDAVRSAAAAGAEVGAGAGADPGAGGEAGENGAPV
jgi:aerobic carbon-monoxide dehydrogenase small subunit